jgi:hypothetical protein
MPNTTDSWIKTELVTLRQVIDKPRSIDRARNEMPL